MQQEKVKAEADKLDNGRNVYRVHFTPDLASQHCLKLVNLNKPFGFRHWMMSSGAPPVGSVVALLDPDFVFMRPLTRKIDEGMAIISGASKPEDGLVGEVTGGHPVAQKYGIGGQWTHWTLTHIAGENSRSRSVSVNDARRFYSVGPPYILHRDDALRLSVHWADYMFGAHDADPGVFADMYAYSIAAAHLELPHVSLDNYMTSNAQAGGEAWSFIDEIDFKDLCAQDLSTTGHKLPTFLHYYQSYNLDKDHWFRKREMKSLIGEASYNLTTADTKEEIKAARGTQVAPAVIKAVRRKRAMEEDGGGAGLTLDVDLTRTINFHGITYIVTTRVTRRDEDGEEMLLVEAEQQHSEDRWTGQFSRQYVEEITHKTGNFKKFGVFVRMLLSALQQRSDSVFVDLLTYSDLELLKARKLGQTSTASAPPRSNNKRYLILTYAVEFDRVHYPLPLVHEDSPGPDMLRKTILRLKQEIEALKQGTSSATPTSQDNSLPSQGDRTTVTARQQQRDLMLLQKENADLRDALRKQMDEMATQKDRTAHVALQRFKEDNEALRQELYQLEESMEELREQSAQEIRKLRREAKDLVQRLQDQQQKHQRELGAGGLNKKRGPSDREVSLRKQVTDLEAALDQGSMTIKRAQAKHRKEMSELVKQLDKEVAAGRILRSRNRDLQRKVAVLSASSTSHNGNRSGASSRASSRPRAVGATSTAPRSRPASTYSSRANSTITSRCSSRANSTLPSRASSAASSRNPSRVHSRDASPRFARSHGSDASRHSMPRGRMDTSKVYGAYDEHGVNVRRARGSNTSPAHRAFVVPITNGPIPGSRYKSPYAQPVRNRSPHRTSSSSATGYQSGPSPDASLARQRGVVGGHGSRPPHSNSPASARTAGRTSNVSAPPIRRRRLRSSQSEDDRSPSPHRRPSHPPSGRSQTQDDEDGMGVMAPVPRTAHSGLAPTASSRMRVTVPTGQKAVSPSLPISTSSQERQSKENQPPSAVLDADSRGAAAASARAVRPAWLDEDEPDSEEEEGTRPVQPQANVLRSRNAQPPIQAAQSQEGDDMCKPEPSGAGPPRNPQDEEEGRGAEESGDFDASSEIGEIDRRLNALQTFLKQAKNGIITRIPVTPRV